MSFRQIAGCIPARRGISSVAEVSLGSGTYLRPLMSLSRTFPASVQCSRLFHATTAFKAKSSEFKVVPFVQEDPTAVFEEVPDVPMYIIGSRKSQTNPYAMTPLDQKDVAVEAAAIASVTPPMKLQTTPMYSKLENGLLMASVDKGGLTASIGLYVSVGCRHEVALDPETGLSETGACHMLENMAWCSSAHCSWLRTVKSLEAVGANAMCSIGREHILYSVECLRKYVPIVIPLITANVLYPRFLPWEMDTNASRLNQIKERNLGSPDSYMTELMHTTAWHNNTLGNKLYCTDSSMQYYSGDFLRQFMLKHMSPDNMVMVGVNLPHEDLTKWTMRSFVDYTAIPPVNRKKETPVYTGGHSRNEAPAPLAYMAVAYETAGGWNGEDLVPLTVLQNIMGGGGSFSTGGPGKGMYTRLFLNVLNRNEWVDSCMSFNTQYTDSGLFGMYMTANPLKGMEMVKVLSEEFSKLGSVTAEELSRAKAGLKSSIWMNLECRQIIMEDLARQLLMGDRVLTGADFCAAIDAVTESDITRVTEKLFSKPPTVVTYGDLSTVPHTDVINSMLPGGKRK